MCARLSKKEKERKKEKKEPPWHLMNRTPGGSVTMFQGRFTPESTCGQHLCGIPGVGQVGRHQLQRTGVQRQRGDTGARLGLGSQGYSGLPTLSPIS